MEKTRVICHMTSSLDGKVTGEFLEREEAASAIEKYYEIHRWLRVKGADGFACGRVTMEGSFTRGEYPNLENFEAQNKEDFVPEIEDEKPFFAVAFDPRGRLGWRQNLIADEDPGYDKSRVVEVLTNAVDGRFLGYLKAQKIPYVFAGEKEIDVRLALEKLSEKLGIKTLILEGGSVINEYFLHADCVDEISLVVAPLTSCKDGKSLFGQGKICGFKLSKLESENDVIVINYVKDKQLK